MQLSLIDNVTLEVLEVLIDTLLMLRLVGRLCHCMVIRFVVFDSSVGAL